MRILLLRHGQTPFNLTGTIDTVIPGANLTDLGTRQARAVPDALAGESIGAIFASSLVRTQLTAQPLSDALGLPIRVLDGLREIEGGDLEGLHDFQSQREYLDIAFGWSRGDMSRHIPGAESGHEFFSRFDGAIETVFEAGVEVAVVVSHGSAIRAWVGGRCTNVDEGFSGHHQLDNTGLAILEGEDIRSLRLLDWRSAPAGGPAFADPSAIDPTGEGLEAGSSRMPRD
jgi:broad specificity phosphatase PhoE